MTSVWMNGSLCDEGDAKVSVFDHGLLYGDGVFEGIRCVVGRVVDLDRHLARLRASGRAIHLAIPDDVVLERAVFETLRSLGADNAYVRLVITRGKGSLGIDTQSCKSPTVFCIAGELQLYPATVEGLRLLTASSRRPPFDVLDPRVKTLNYLNNVLAKYEAKQRGGDEALVLNHRGTVAEASGANVFCVTEGRLFTPPLSDGALGGITRQRMLKLARQDGIETVEVSLSRVDLLMADEVFLTGTGAGIVAAGQLDGEPLGRNRTMSERLAQLNLEYARHYGRPIEVIQPPSVGAEATVSWQAMPSAGGDRS